MKKEKWLKSLSQIELPDDYLHYGCIMLDDFVSELKGADRDKGFAEGLISKHNDNGSSHWDVLYDLKSNFLGWDDDVKKWVVREKD